MLKILKHKCMIPKPSHVPSQISVFKNIALFVFVFLKTDQMSRADYRILVQFFDRPH